MVMFPAAWDGQPQHCLAVEVTGHFGETAETNFTVSCRLEVRKQIEE